MSQERLKIRDLHEGDPEYVPDGDPPVYHPMVLVVDGWESVTPGDELVPVEALEAALEEARALKLWIASDVARAHGLAQAISECRDDARLDGIREGAGEVASLLARSALVSREPDGPPR